MRFTETAVERYRFTTGLFLNFNLNLKILKKYKKYDKKLHLLISNIIYKIFKFSLI